jgi:hypothetical protein
MSFLRHEEIYRSDVALSEAGSGSGGCRPQCSSATMSFQSAIPWPVALRQSQASASPTGNDSQQSTLPYNDFSANGNSPLNSVSHPRGALQRNTWLSLHAAFLWGDWPAEQREGSGGTYPRCPTLYHGLQGPQQGRGYHCPAPAAAMCRPNQSSGSPVSGPIGL